MNRPARLALSLVAAGVLALAACSSSSSPTPTTAMASAPSSSPAPAPASAAPPAAATFTPVLAEVLDAPTPFVASDGRTHLVYELLATNASSGVATISRIEVLDADTGAVVDDLPQAEVAASLQLLGQREPSSDLPAAASGLVFLDITVPEPSSVPARVVHRLTATTTAAPEGTPPSVYKTAATEPTGMTVPLLSPPLAGKDYISADSCCDSYRHRRAALPLDGRLWLSQRFAVDWEKLDAKGRVFAGDPQQVESYAIYGENVLAVADARVVAAVDGMPDQVPPGVEGVTLQNADGNHVVLDLGGGAYALFAHLIPGSLTVAVGDTVTAGQVLGRVGNSGNSIAPHLHFHVMGGSSPLASSGLPYALTAFDVTGRVAGDTAAARTAAFDAAEGKGTVLPVTTGPEDGPRTQAFPLNQLIVTLPAR